MTALTVTLTDIATAVGMSKRGIEIRSAREKWAYTEEAVRGGKLRQFDLQALPADVRSQVINAKKDAALAALGTEIEASRSNEPGRTRREDLTDAERLREDARVGILAALNRLRERSGCSQEAAMTTLLTQAQSGELQPALDKMLRLARDPRGRKSGDGIYPTPRSLKRWINNPRPTGKKKDIQVPAWAKTFLACWQQPQKPSVESAYQQFCELVPSNERPSIHQVRRFLTRLGTVTRERGRMGPRELKNIRTFVRRTFEELEPNDVWTADGHTFDAEVQHPLHGRPFRPEITTFIDIATRRAVGWSVALSESGWAVADALRHSVERNGIPAIIYVDNGSGYRNAMMSDEATGLIGRLQSSIEHSLPYNSQARGVIERAHKTIWVAGAKMLPSFIGAAMDREARLEQFKLTRRALKQGGTMPLIPWDLFTRFVQERVDAYNAQAHRSLRKRTPDQVLAEFVAGGWTPETLTVEETETLFRPRAERTVQRGELRLFNNIYFSRELEEFHGAEVHVAYDIHDANTVWVYLPDGRFVGTAQVNGNARHYFPVPVVEQARQKRAQGRLNRIDVQREEILAELNGSAPLLAVESAPVVIGGRVMQPDAVLAMRRDQIAAAEPTEAPAHVPNIAPRSRSERTGAENLAEWHELGERIANGGAVSDADRRFYERWPSSPQGRAMQKREAADSAAA